MRAPLFLFAKCIGGTKTMIDDLSQAPNEPIIQTEEVAAESPEEGSPQAQQQKEKPMTAEDYRQIAREEAIRVAQSQVAKSENRINQRITERFTALEANKGVLNLTDDQVANAKRSIIEEEQMKEFSPAQRPQINGEEQPAANVDVDPGQVMDSLNTHAFTLAGGTVVTPQDKEWKLMEQAWKDPQGNADKYILAAIDASRGKAQRLAAQSKNAQARVTGTGGATSVSLAYDPNKPASYYLEQAEKEKRTN